MPLYFKDSKYTSFTRRLNRWNFTIQTHGHKKASYFHPMFIRGDPVRCLDMKPSSQSRKNSMSVFSRDRDSSEPPKGELPLTNSGKDEGHQESSETESDQKQASSRTAESHFKMPNSYVANESHSALAASASQQWRNMDPIPQQMRNSNIDPRYHAMLSQTRLNSQRDAPSHWQGAMTHSPRFYPNLMHNTYNALPFGGYSPQSHLQTIPPQQSFLSNPRTLMQQQNFPPNFADLSRSAVGSAHLPPRYGVASFPTGMNSSNLGINPLVNQSYLSQQSVQDIPASLRIPQTLSNIDQPAQSFQGDKKHSDGSAGNNDKGAKSSEDKQDRSKKS